MSLPDGGLLEGRSLFCGACQRLPAQQTLGLRQTHQPLLMVPADRERLEPVPILQRRQQRPCHIFRRRPGRRLALPRLRQPPLLSDGQPQAQGIDANAPRTAGVRVHFLAQPLGEAVGVRRIRRRVLVGPDSLSTPLCPRRDDTTEAAVCRRRPTVGCVGCGSSLPRRLSDAIEAVGKMREEAPDDPDHPSRPKPSFRC